MWSVHSRIHSTSLAPPSSEISAASVILRLNTRHVRLLAADLLRKSFKSILVRESPGLLLAEKKFVVMSDLKVACVASILQECHLVDRVPQLLDEESLDLSGTAPVASATTILNLHFAWHFFPFF